MKVFFTNIPPFSFFIKAIAVGFAAGFILSHGLFKIVSFFLR